MEKTMTNKQPVSTPAVINQCVDMRSSGRSQFVSGVPSIPPLPKPPRVPTSNSGPQPRESSTMPTPYLPVESWLTNKLLGLLIINLSLLDVLLGASIYKVLDSDSLAFNKQTDSKVSSQLAEAGTPKTTSDQNVATEFQSDSSHDTNSNSSIAESGPEPIPSKTPVESDIDSTIEDSAETMAKKSDKNQKEPSNEQLYDQVASTKGHLADKATQFSADSDSVDQVNDNATLLVSDVANESLTENPNTKTLETCTPPKLPIAAPYYGTRIEWNRVVDDAASKAKSEHKLVFLIHVSGNFTKEEFT